MVTSLWVRANQTVVTSVTCVHTRSSINYHLRAVRCSCTRACIFYHKRQAQKNPAGRNQRGGVVGYPSLDRSSLKKVTSSSPSL